MLCCGFVLLILAAAAGWWRRLTRATRRLAPTVAVDCAGECHPGAPSRPVLRGLPVVAALAALLAVSALAAHHLGHYLDRARANQRTLLAELMAQPICTGAVHPQTLAAFDVARREQPATPPVP
jgi:hypothetical protein